MSKFSLSLVRMISSTERSLKMFLLFFMLFFMGAASFAQQRQMRNPDVIIGELIKTIPSLKDYKTPAGFVAPITRIRDRVVGLNEDNENIQRTQYSKVETPDPVVQKAAGGSGIITNMASPNPTPGNFAGGVVTQNFAGLPYTNVAPADPNMCAGPTAVIQTINNSSSSFFKIWDRNGNVLLNQTLIVNLVASPGYTGSGDPVAMYDQMADRYLLTEFGHAGAGSGINTLIACVSQTGNPLGAWYIYKFTDNTFFPDYPKWGAMPNAYYASTNDFNTAGTAYLGSSVYAFNKTKMLAGDITAEAQRFRLSFNSFPVNVIGSTPPLATNPGMFMYYSDDDFTADPNDKDSIGFVLFNPNFAVPANTVLTVQTNSLMTAPFKSSFCGGRNCVPSASGNGYDGLADRIMNRVIYRNFGTYESIVLNYTVDANVGLGSPRAGLRWYELRRPTPASPWAIYQQSTYAPCGTDWRWMGSININSKGQIALGYDLSSTTKFASMYFTGRNATDPLNTMTVAETLIQAGTAYGTFANRWGDYNEVTPDVVNDSLFWMTSMWGSAASSWATRVAQFKLGDCNVESSSFTFTQAQPSVPEGQNIVYTNTVNNTGCVALTNYLMTDTLPSNVTFVSATNGGTYNAGNRVVSWTVNVAVGTSQTYSFTVNINAGSYFPPVTLLNEPVAGPGLPAGWTATVGTGPNNWVVSSAQSHSPPSSLFGVDNATAITDFRITSSPIALGPPSAKLTFWHNYNTESGWDGGVVEISTNGGGTWVDLGPRMTINGYNNSVGGTNPIAGRSAFSGNSGGWIQTTVDLTPYANQTAQFRFRMTSDDNTAATGWYVDDINITSVAQVNMRTTLSGAACANQFHDTVTLILAPSGCTGQTVNSQPANVTTCNGTAASFTVGATGTLPITYQWQESIAGVGGPYLTITNGGIYSGATTTTLNLSTVTLAMNGYAYRCVVSGCAASSVNSNPALLTVVSLSVGGTVTPATTSICGTTNTGTLTLSGQTGSVINWESSIVSAAGPFTTVVPTNTTTTLTFNNLPVTTYFRAVVQAPGCATANSSVATVTIIPGGLPMFIVADPGTTVCSGDPTRLTVMEGAAASGNIATNFAAGNGNFVITFNFRNNNAFPVTLTDIASLAFAAGASNVQAWYSSTSISGSPGAITGPTWVQFGSAAITAIGGTTVQPFMSGLTLSVPAGATYRILVSCATAANGFNMGYSTLAAGVYTFSAGGCDIVTGTNIGYGGGVIPSVPGNTPRGFIGNVTFSGGSLSPVTTGTFLWSPATGLSSTTTNPVAASPAVTTTYTVNHNNGAGCIRVASITLNVNQRPVVTTQPANITVCSTTTASFTVTATGTGITYQWQESTNGGILYNNLLNIAPYSGVTTPTLTINPVAFAMNGNRYRCVVSGTCAPGLGNPNISSGAILSVNPAPTVTVTPTVSCGGPSPCNPLTASGANTYTWSPVTGLYLDCAATVPYTAGTNAATVYANPLVNTIYTVTGTTTATGCTGTATATVNYTPAAPTVSPASVAMCLGDAAVPLTITSSLAPTTITLTNSTSVAIPDNTATATTSVINVAGVPANAVISAMSVTLNMPHTYPADMVINLKAPNGQILSLFKHNTNTDNGAVSIPTAGFFNAVVNSSSVVQFKAVPTPYRYGITPPAGPYQADALNGVTNPGYTIMDPAGFVSNAASFANLYLPTPNGAWTLAMCDGGPGDLGTLQSWTLSFTYGVPSGGIWTPNGIGAGLFTDAAASNVYTGTVAQTVYAKPAVSTTYSVTVNTGNCTSLPTLVPVTVNVPVNITAQPVNAIVCTDKVATFTVVVTGTSPGYQWQVSTNGGASFSAVVNGAPYSGATTATLTITAPPVTMNGYVYRCAIAGALPCPTVFSANRTLTVNPLPIVVISASPYRALWPGLTTTLSSTSTPAAAIYTWYRNNAVVTGATTGSYVVDIDHLGTYKLTVTDVNGCFNTSNLVTISDSLSGRVFIYPNPNSGLFQVRYNPVHNNVTPYGINILDALGKRISSQNYTLGTAYAPMYVNLGNYSTGVYWVEVVDVDGNRLAMGRVEILR